MIERNMLVRVKSNDGFYGKTGRVTSLPSESEDNRYGVTIPGEREEWFFHRNELQELVIGTKVLIEVEIRDFVGEEFMMVADVWVPLSRIVRVVE